MKILLANNTLSILAGSETHTYTLAVQLEKMGHNVSCYSPELGIISDKLAEKDIPSFNQLNIGEVRLFSPVLEEDREHNYDLIIANHFHIVRTLRARFPKTPIISTVHGILHFMDDTKTVWAPEHPAVDAGVSQFIAVSEEVRDLLKKDYNIDAKIIRNFFDLKRFDLAPPQKKPKQFLINTNYMGPDDPVIKLIKDTGKLIGAKVGAIGVNFAQNFDTTIAIKDADVVFGMGRSVLEGMAAGRLGVCLGRWGYGGIITEATIDAIRAFNFSGRNSAPDSLPTPSDLATQIQEAYQPTVLDWSKKYIAREHNVALAAERFVSIGEELTGATINKPVVASGVHPDAQPLKKNYED